MTYIDGVAVLTSENYEDFLRLNRFVMVKFYAPWCGHCKTMASGYARLAKKLKDDKRRIVIAKVDATVEGEFAEDFEVSGFPTLILFHNGSPITYEGSREEDAIEEWIGRQVSFKVTVIETESELDQMQSSKLSVLLTCAKTDVSLIKRFTALAAANESVVFRISHLENTAKILGTEGPLNFIVFRDFDDGRKTLPLERDSEWKSMKDFLASVRNAAVLDWEESAQDIFGKKKPVIIFFGEEGKSSEFSQFYEVAQLKRDEIVFVRASISEGTGGQFAEHIGLATDEGNQVRILNFGGQDIHKFRVAKLDKQSIIRFIDDWKANKLKPYLKSQKVPRNDRGAVKTIVGDSFDELVLKSSKYVLLEVFSPNNKVCKDFEPVYTKMASKLSKVTELMVGKMDGTANDHPAIKSTNDPTILLFKLRQKKNPVEYKGALNYQSLVQFLEKELDRDLIFAEDMDEDDGL